MPLKTQYNCLLQNYAITFHSWRAFLKGIRKQVPGNQEEQPASTRSRKTYSGWTVTQMKYLHGLIQILLKLKRKQFLYLSFLTKQVNMYTNLLSTVKENIQCVSSGYIRSLTGMKIHPDIQYKFNDMNVHFPVRSDDLQPKAAI